MKLTGSKPISIFIATALLFANAAFILAADDVWKKEANARIEKHRKRDVQAIVMDQQGNPIAGASVIINQTLQAYPFGAAVGGDFLRDERAQEFFKKHFNWAVFGNESKWYSNEVVKGREDYRIADAMFSWFAANNIPVRGHCIFWEPEKWQPRWVRGLSADQLHQAIEQRCTSAVTHFKGKFVHWDVNNEMLHGSFYKDRLGESIWLEMFKRAHELAPETKLFVNDFNVLSVDQDFDKVQTDEYVASIRRLLDQGAPIQGIGIQGHIWREDILANPGVLKERLDKVAALNLPIWITEFDVADDDETSCADKLELVYRTCFSHPMVEGIFTWVISSAGSWRGPNAGLAHRDWTLNEAGVRYEALMKEWTTQTTGTTDKDGRMSFRGFLGNYKAKVTKADGSTTDASFSIEKGQDAQKITIELKTQP